MPRLARTIHLREPVEGVETANANGRLRRAGKYVYRAGERFDDQAARKLDPKGRRPNLWQPEEPVEAAVTTVADTGQTADTTGGGSGDGEQQSGPEEGPGEAGDSSAGDGESAGDSSPAEPVDGPPPRSGPQGSRDNWAAYAAKVGVHIEEDASRDDIIAELETRGLT